MKNYFHLVAFGSICVQYLAAQSLRFESGTTANDGFVPFFPKVEPSTAYGSDTTSTNSISNSRQSSDDDGFRFSNENRNDQLRQYGNQPQDDNNFQADLQQPSYVNQKPYSGFDQQQPNYVNQKPYSGYDQQQPSYVNQKPSLDQRPSYQRPQRPQRPSYEDNTITSAGQNGGYGLYKPPQTSTPFYSPYPGYSPNNPYFQTVNYADSYNGYQPRPPVKRPRPPPNYPLSNPPTGPSYYPPNPGARPIYASQFANYQSQQNANPVLNFLSNLVGGPSGPTAGGYGGGGYFGPSGPGQPNPGNIIGRLAQAVETITKYDDLQCVPKIVCQMIGDPNRRQQLPSFLNQPTMSALFAALPSTSPFLTYTRAALIGLSGGNRNCDSTFARCPRGEDDILNYLNNHRGGFFRLFNSGTEFGDLDQQQYRPQQQFGQQPSQQGQQQFGQRPYQQDQQQQQQPGSGVDLAALQNLADVINNSGGINLSNLGGLGTLLANGAALGGGSGGGIASLLGGGPQVPGQNLGTYSLLDSNNYGGIFSNLLSGLVGQRYSGKSNRRTQRSSIEARSTNSTSVPEKEKDKDDKISEDEPEARIVNNKDIKSTLVDSRPVFPDDGFRRPKVVNSIGDELVLKFPDVDGPNPTVGTFFPEDAPSRKTKMIFPDRTGTGQLVIDSEYLEKDLATGTGYGGTRFGKILSGPKYPSGFSSSKVQFENDYLTTTSPRPYIDFSSNNRRPVSYYTNQNSVNNNNNYDSNRYYDNNRYNRYEDSRYTTTPRYTYNRYSGSNSNRGEDTSNRVYVTNSKGQTEYYIDASGKKNYI